MQTNLTLIAPGAPLPSLAAQPSTINQGVNQITTPAAGTTGQGVPNGSGGLFQAGMVVMGVYSATRMVVGSDGTIKATETRDLVPLLTAGFQVDLRGGGLTLTAPSSGGGVIIGLTGTKYTPDGSGKVTVNDSRDLLSLLLAGYQ